LLAILLSSLYLFSSLYGNRKRIFGINPGTAAIVLFYILGMYALFILR